ncbi:Metallo-dependent hydrolase [Athelia psychrophila]|uniref:Metallo-dependent hydrolase n=1 Tax=Athelia psychrophila TaxID=1759441 RepID=A0A166C6U5_9AGAM|nr:Metallo-dependent hydrolase [Fibularhizoctonia sp. CBS 109695]
MGKKSNTPAEEQLLLPKHLTAGEAIVDTHTHLLSTFASYRLKYPAGKYETVYDFVRGLYTGLNVEAIVDVWCEAPVMKEYRELADSADARDERWGGIGYWFVMEGVPSHQANMYTDEVERDILEAMKHPRCVGWGEMGLDYHYDNSPRAIQQEVFTRQLRQAVALGKALTIHTREAEEDTERILKAEVPQAHKIHIHCFTDSPDFAQRLLDYFPNLCIGITGVVSYATNFNTPNLLRQMTKTTSPPHASPLRILLETDAPYMIPANIYASLTAPDKKPKRLPLCHTGMIPWTADFVAGVLNEGVEWDAARVMKVARDNARAVYGV